MSSPTPSCSTASRGYPLIGRTVEWARENAPVSAEQLQGWVTNGAQGLLKAAAGMSGAVALGLVGTLVSFFLMLFLLFFLLRDGRDAHAA